MNTLIKSRIIELAAASSQEICGFIYWDRLTVDLYPCRNIALDPTSDFEISMEDQLECMKRGKPIAVYHSHPAGPPAFSEADIESCEELTLPYYLYDVVSRTWLEYLPKSHILPLEGREFIWGIADCYETPRLYFRQKFGIYLGDYDRDHDFDSNAISENFRNEGFIELDPKVTPIKDDDALLFDLKKKWPQHLGVFVGTQRWLHHPLNALSRIDQLDDRWLGHLKSILRHKTLV